MPVKKTKITKKDIKDAVLEVATEAIKKTLVKEVVEVKPLTIEDHEAMVFHDTEGTHGIRHTSFLVTNLPGWTELSGDVSKSVEFRKYDTGTITMTVIGPLQEIPKAWMENEAGVRKIGPNGLEVVTESVIEDLRKHEHILHNGMEGTYDTTAVAKLNRIDPENLGGWVDVKGEQCSLWTRILEIPTPHDPDVELEDNSRSIFE